MNHIDFKPASLKGTEKAEYKALASTDRRRQYGACRRHGYTHAAAIEAVSGESIMYRSVRFEDGCYSR